MPHFIGAPPFFAHANEELSGGMVLAVPTSDGLKAVLLFTKGHYQQTNQHDI
jgi:hypothetical protein